MRKVSISLILCLGLCAVVNAGKIDDKSVSGGVYTLAEASGVITLTVDTIAATTISGGTMSGTTLAGGSLANGKILVGNASGVATAVTPAGDVTLSNAGATAIASGVIVNDDVKSDAAIASSKLATDVVRSGDTTAKQLIQSGTLNVADVTAQTNTFTVAYKSGTTPIVTATYKTTAGDVQPVFITNVASNFFVATIAATNMPINWIAIGEKP